MYLVINKCVTAVKVSNFSGHYLRNRSTLDMGVLVYIGIVQHKEHSPEVLSIPPGTSCINPCLSSSYTRAADRHLCLLKARWRITSTGCRGQQSCIQHSQPVACGFHCDHKCTLRCRFFNSVLYYDKNLRTDYDQAFIPVCFRVISGRPP